MMIKPFWAIAGVAVLGTVGAVGALVVASSGGEEEAALQTQQTQTAAPTTVVPTAAPTAAVTPSDAPTPQPSPDGVPADWETYTDAVLGFSFPHPPGLTVSERVIEFPEKNGNAAVQVRTLTFTSTKAAFTLGLAIAPNPSALSLEEWINTYPGWPGQPTEMVIDTERALLFPIDQQGENFPQIYFERGGVVFTLQGNVYGHQGKPSAVSQADFQLIIDHFRFPR